MISRRIALLGVLACGGLISSQLSAIARSSRPVSFAAIDSDHDGTLDLEEVQKAAAALFNELDADHDGLSIRDFQTDDSDKDGTLTKGEFLAIVKERFKDADIDHDGTLSPSEFKSRAGLVLPRLLH
jgi:Ca2+-binding EF-hand superfamily protein